MHPATSDAEEKAHLQGLIDGKRALQQLADRGDTAGYSEREHAAYRRGWIEAIEGDGDE